MTEFQQNATINRIHQGVTVALMGLCVDRAAEQGIPIDVVDLLITDISLRPAQLHELRSAGMTVRQA